MKRVYHDSEIILARRRLGDLARLVGVTPQGQRYVPAWFTTDKVCRALDMQIAHMQGKSWGIRRLWVKLPPQTGKSFHASELFPSGIIGRLPTARLVITGYGNEFLERTIPAIKFIVQSEGYRAAYPHVNLGAVAAMRDAARDNTHRVEVVRREMGEWRKTGGYVLARSFGGAINSVSMDGGIVDDAYKGWKQANSAAENKERRDFYTGVFRFRQQSRRTTMTLATTPWTPTDLGAFIEDQWRKDGDPYLILTFPTFSRADTKGELERWKNSPAMREGLARYLEVDAEALDAVVNRWGLRPYDERQLGYPLLPFGDRDVEFYEQIRRGSTARDLAALVQLDPESEAVETFPRRHWRVFDPTVKTKWRKLVLSCDPNAKATEGGSFAACGTWGLDASVDQNNKPTEPSLEFVDNKPAHPWVMDRLDEVRERPSYGDLADILVRQLDRWPETKILLLEDKAHGSSLAGDRNFLARLKERGIRTIHKFGKIQAEKTQISEGLVLVEPSDNYKDRWARMEVPHRCGHLRVPSKSHDRVMTHYLHDRPEKDDEGAAQGFYTEFTRAGQTPWDDRVDEAAQVCDFASTQVPHSGLSRFRAYA